MKPFLLAVFVLLLSGAVHAAAATPAPHPSPEAAERGLSSMKGWELYLWREGAQTFYSLLVGTNRNKDDDEISKAAVNSLDALKEKLGELRPGEFVTLFGRRERERPPEEAARAVKDFGDSIGLKIHWARPMAAATAFNASQTAADLATKIQPQRPAAWSISVEKNTIRVTRQKPVEWYGTISLPPHEDKAELKAQGYVHSGTYTIKVQVSPPVTAEEVAKLAKENDSVLDDYYRKHPADPQQKPVSPPREVTEKLHPIPDVLTKGFSAVVTPFIQGSLAFYNEEDEKECRDVEREVRRVLAGTRDAASDPIDRLVSQLSSNPLWQTGRAPGIRLPQDASAEQVVAVVFKMTGFDHGRVTNHRILEARQVHIRPGSDEYTAALIETNLGEKVVLFGFVGGPLGWWSRVFDVEAPAKTPAAPSTRPILKTIQVHYGIYVARADLVLTISPEGLLRSVRTDNKSYGPNDISKDQEHVEIREGNLTPKQMVDLARMLDGWEKLQDKYGGVPDGPEIEFRYGDKQVSGGSEIPKQVWDVYGQIRKLADNMPIVRK